MIVKVCGVGSAAVADAAIEAGADWLGIVLVPRSPRHVDDEQARAVVAAVRGRADIIGVMLDASAADCADAAARYRLAAVQVHGSVAPDLAERTPVPLVRALNVRTAHAALLDEWWPDCLVVLDSAPATDAQLPGGTGARVDVEVAAAVARHRPLVLAGGLGPASVAEAIAAVRPHGVDASSGLETAPGVKDVALVDAYVRAARTAFEALA